MERRLTESPRKTGTVDRSDVVCLEGELAASIECNKELEAKVSSLSGELATVRERVNEMWKLNCAQVVAFDETITAKNAEIEWLTAKVAELEASLVRAPDVDSARVTQTSLTTSKDPSGSHSSMSWESPTS